MPFNVNKIRQDLAQNGYLRTNRFFVVLTPPKILQNTAVNTLGTPTASRDISNQMTMRIEQIRTPGISLEFADVNKYSVGPTRKFPINAKFQEIDLTILSDGYGNIWQFWHNWINKIFNFTSTTNFSGGSFQVNELANYNVEYKSEYSTNMGIVIGDSFGNGILRIDLFEAFPVSFREIQMNWGENSSLIKLGITVTFSEYVITGSSIESQFKQIENNIKPPTKSTKSTTITT